MKGLKNTILKCSLFILFIAISTLYVNAQNKKDTNIKHLVESKNYVFIAETVTPTRVTMNRPLSFGYDLRVSADSIVSYLPYFGRAYSATYDATGGIKFTATDFEYEVKEKKKGWDIIITPKDVRDVRTMRLSISKSGYATLQVTSNFRDPISFRGEIRERN